MCPTAKAMGVPNVVGSHRPNYTSQSVRCPKRPAVNAFAFFFFFLLNIFTQDIPLGWKPLQMWGPAQHTLLHKQ